MKRLVITFILLLALAVVVLPGPAAAHQITTVGPSFNIFTGRASSKLELRSTFCSVGIRSRRPLMRSASSVGHSTSTALRVPQTSTSSGPHRSRTTRLREPGTSTSRPA